MKPLRSSHLSHQAVALGDMKTASGDKVVVPGLRSRVVVGSAVLLATLSPLLALAQLAYDIRVETLTEIYRESGGLPAISRILAPFGPIDLWSYLTPIALGVAAGAAWKVRLSGGMSIAVLLSVALQLAGYWAAFAPYAALLQMTGVIPRWPYPWEPFVANLSLVVVSWGSAIWAVAKARARGRAHAMPSLE
ncbi:hypothetical protein HNR46_003107 [Haloferula luteola]|uniref:Uncharacterized protein n=1 Tax=Haloferula luteola TaxID=595692 RepID=A0A840VGB1_9BACT|nr:hypothetical protein [Haloferula luteola]MBB5352859.1 hypothetical protein [Haloferula luteola]